MAVPGARVCPAALPGSLFGCTLQLTAKSAGAGVVTVALTSKGPGNIGGAEAARLEALAAGVAISAPAAMGISTAMTAVATRYLRVRKSERVRGTILRVSFENLI